MAGFADINAIVNALTVNGYGQALPWAKKKAANTAAAGLYSLWGEEGTPAAGVYTGTVQDGIQATSSTTGAIIYTNPGGSRDMFALTATGNMMASAGSGTLLLWDRLLYYPGIDDNSNALQTFTNGVALPRYTTGVGVHMFLEQTAVGGATARTATILYQDPDGNETAAETTGAQTVAVSSVAGRFPHTFSWFPLAAGDKGVKRATSIQYSAAGGTANATTCLVLAKLLTMIPLTATGPLYPTDHVRGPLLLPEIQDDACLFWTFDAGSAASVPSFAGLVQLCEN